MARRQRNDAPKLTPSALGQRAAEYCDKTEEILILRSDALTGGDGPVLEDEQLWQVLRGFGYQLRPVTPEVRADPAQVLVVLADAVTGVVAQDPEAIQLVTECERALGLPTGHVRQELGVARGGGGSSK